MNQKATQLDQLLQSYSEMSSRHTNVESRPAARRWLSYAAATSAGVIASASTQTGLAAVVHSGPINQLLQGNQNFAVNLNNDTIGDFFFANQTISSGASWRAAMVGISGGAFASTFSSSVTSISTLFFTYVDRVDASQEIPANLSFFSGTGNIRRRSQFGPSYFGNFSDTGFVGVRVPVDGDNHYGWIRLDVDEVNRRFTVVDWAYEDEPNTPILAGDVGTPGLLADFDEDDDVDGNDFLAWQQGFGTTHSSTELNHWETEFGEGVGVSQASSSVPEPTTLGLLATGAAGVLAQRRRRKTAE